MLRFRLKRATGAFGMERVQVVVAALARIAHVAALRLSMLLLGCMFVAQVLVVVLRYLFGIGFVELQDFVLFCFAALSVLGVPVALRLDRHVRVDVFRPSGTTRAARRIDQLSYVLLLAPVFAVTLWYVMPLVINSWAILEGSRETGGLGGYYLVMTALPLACVLMLLQGLALLLDRTLIHAEPR